MDTVAAMDLGPFFAHYERELRGQPPFHPRMMVTLLLYCYATGTRSSRRIMNRCRADVTCRVIVGNDIPGFRTISDFRKIHLERLETLFVEVLKLCALAGLAKVGTISLDGTKIKANASRHKAMSYDRMEQEEKRLKEEIAKILAEAKVADETEDACHGPDRHGDELPDELARRQSRLAKIQQAKSQLEERARAKAAAEAAVREAEGKAPPAIAGVPAVLTAWSRVNARRVAVAVRSPQPVEVVAPWPEDGGGGMIALETPAKSASSRLDSAVRGPEGVRGGLEAVKGGRRGK
jgi:transposase